MIQSSKSAQKAQVRRTILTATIGCAIEFYDFVTFAFFAIQIGNCFFPSHDHYLSLMGSLATFGAGFISRPIGANVLGKMADRVGRAHVLQLSMLLMGGAIATLALTPSYAQIGWIAPVIAVSARLVQGFALGGEIGSSTVYMVETADPENRGLMASWQAVSQYVAASLGALVGFVLSSVMTPADLSSYGWRLALLVGVTVVPAAYHIRKNLHEVTVEPEPEPANSKPLPSFRQIVWLGSTIMATSTVGNYIFNYMATFGQTELHMSTGAAMLGTLTANLVGLIASIAGGYLCDRLGRRPMQLVPQIGLVFAVIPCFAWLLSARSVFSFICVNLILSTLNNLGTPALWTAIVESVKPAVRARAFALIYAIPVAIFGSTTQLFVAWLLRTTGTPMALGYYMTAVALVGLAAILPLPESAPSKRLVFEPDVVPQS